MVVIQATADERVADPKSFQARDDDDGSICAARRPMGPNQGPSAGEGGRLRCDRQRQSPIYPSSALDGTNGSPVAQRICSFRAVARNGRMATCLDCGVARSGHGRIDDRQHDRAGTPTRSWRPKKSGVQAIGRSRVGLTTKIHAAVDALGNPVRTILTAGQQADITQAEALIAGFAANSVLADKGYDADAFVAKIESQGAHAVIPPRSNRNEQRAVDWYLYKNRNLVERFFNRLKQYRRVATRYDKLDTSFLCFIFLACSIIWLL